MKKAIRMILDMIVLILVPGVALLNELQFESEKKA